MKKITNCWKGITYPLLNHLQHNLWQNRNKILRVCRAVKTIKLLCINAFPTYCKHMFHNTKRLERVKWGQGAKGLQKLFFFIIPRHLTRNIRNIQFYISVNLSLNWTFVSFFFIFYFPSVFPSFHFFPYVITTFWFLKKR